MATILSLLHLGLLAVIPITSLGTQPTVTSSDDVIIPGQTDQLTINCSLNHNNDFSLLISLILSKDGLSQNVSFTEIVSFYSAQGDKADIKTSPLSPHATATAHYDFSVTQDAFVSFTVKNPDTAAVGKYKCTAFGSDADGHPLTAESVVVVTQTTATTTKTSSTPPRDVSTCEFNPCSNGGVCFKVKNNFACVCPPVSVRLDILALFVIFQ